MIQTSIRRLTLLAFAVFTTACGTMPANGLRPAHLHPTAAPTAAPALPPAAAGSAQALFAQAQAAFAALPAYEGEMSFYQKQGAKVAKGLYQIAGQRPRALRVEIKQGNSTGTKLLWQGGDTVKVRPGGFLSALSLNLSLTDDRVISVRGYNLSQTDVKGFYSQLSDPSNQLSLGAPGPQGPALEATGPKLLKGCTQMRVVLDATTLLPASVVMRDAKEEVFRVEFKNLRRKSSVSLTI